MSNRTKWNVEIFFFDRINQKKHKTSHIFYPLYTYYDLYEEIHELVRKIGWEFNKKIRIVFEYALQNGETSLVTNWNNYILDSDIIHVILYYSTDNFYILSNRNGDVLLKGKDISVLYENTDMFDYEILLIYQINDAKNIRKLIDVIGRDNISRNLAINRLIRNYYEKYKITI